MNADKYRDLFIVEGEAHIEALSRSVVMLENIVGGGRNELINEIFRSLHSMKGMAASMGYDELSALCHRLEELASDVREQRMAITRELVDLWLASIDAFGAFVKAVRARGNLPSLSELIARAAAFTAPLTTPSAVVTTPRAAPLRMPVPEPLTSMRVKTSVLDELLDLADELVVADAQSAAAGEPRERLHQAVRQVHERVMALRVVPFGSIAERYPRVVRDAARSLGKWVELEIEGGSVELDRAVLEAVDPVLIHLLLNAVDHGIETQRSGKNAIGRIVLSARQQRDGTIISVRDDGAGIDMARLREEAERRGVALPTGELGSDLLVDVLSSPGFSTKVGVTNTSGRGVGMDVVRTTIEGLGGKVAVQSQPGVSTTFVLQLPLSLALFSVLRIEHGGAMYGLPLQRVSQTTAIDARQPGNSMQLRDRNLVVRSLDDLLGLKATAPPRWLAVIKNEPEDFAIALEQIVDVVDVMVKKVGPPLDDMPLIEGAAVLPDGRPMLVLDLAAVLR